MEKSKITRRIKTNGEFGIVKQFADNFGPAFINFKKISSLPRKNYLAVITKFKDIEFYNYKKAKFKYRLSSNAFLEKTVNVKETFIYRSIFPFIKTKILKMKKTKIGVKVLDNLTNKCLVFINRRSKKIIMKTNLKSFDNFKLSKSEFFFFGWDYNSLFLISANKKEFLAVNYRKRQISLCRADSVNFGITNERSCPALIPCQLSINIKYFQEREFLFIQRMEHKKENILAFSSKVIETSKLKILKIIFLKTKCRKEKIFAYFLFFFVDKAELIRFDFTQKIRRPFNFLEDIEWNSTEKMYPGYYSERKILRTFVCRRFENMMIRWIDCDFDDERAIFYVLSDDLYYFKLRKFINK